MLLPPAKANSLRPTHPEDIFLSIVGNKECGHERHMSSATRVVMPGGPFRSTTHREHGPIITVTIMPLAFMLLFRYVFGGAIRAQHRQLWSII